MSNQTHLLKIEEQYFDLVASGAKTYEIRFNDRGYKSGDVVYLHCKEAGKEISAIIGYVCDYEQKDNFVVFSLLDVLVLSRGSDDK